MRFPAIVAVALRMAVFGALCVTTMPATLVSRPLSVAARTELERSLPSADAVLHETPTHVEVWFTEQVDPALIQLVVVGPDGARVDRGDLTVDPQDPEHHQVTVSLRAGLIPGDYTAHWNVDSASGNAEAFGDFRFTLTDDGASCSVASPVAATSTTAACVPAPPETDLGTPITVDGVVVTLQASGTDAGPVDLSVLLVDAAGAPIDDAQVTVRARHLEMDHGEFPRVAAFTSAGRYVANGVGMGMGGKWRVAVDVIRPGHDPVTAFFRVDMKGLT